MRSDRRGGGDRFDGGYRPPYNLRDSSYPRGGGGGGSSSGGRRDGLGQNLRNIKWDVSSLTPFQKNFYTPTARVDAR